MALASELRSGLILKLDRDFYKVVESEMHAGGGKAGSMVHAKLRNLSTGHVAERRFSPDDKLEDVDVTRSRMQFLYKDGDVFQFMNPETFDQVPIPRSAIGAAAAFLKENDEIEVEFHEDKPLSVLYAREVELKVESAPSGIHGDTTFKEVKLENGMMLLAPQFIKEGDRVRVEVETGKYLERVSDREAKGAKFTTSAPPPKPAEEKKAPPAPKPEGRDDRKK